MSVLHNFLAYTCFHKLPLAKKSNDEEGIISSELTFVTPCVLLPVSKPLTRSTQEVWRRLNQWAELVTTTDHCEKHHCQRLLCYAVISDDPENFILGRTELGQNWDRVRALTNVRASTLNSSTAVMIPLHVVTLHTFVKTLMWQWLRTANILVLMKPNFILCLHDWFIIDW